MFRPSLIRVYRIKRKLTRILIVFLALVMLLSPLVINSYAAPSEQSLLSGYSVSYNNTGDAISKMWWKNANLGNAWAEGEFIPYHLELSGILDAYPGGLYEMPEIIVAYEFYRDTPAPGNRFVDLVRGFQVSATRVLTDDDQGYPFTETESIIIDTVDKMEDAQNRNSVELWTDFSALDLGLDHNGDPLIINGHHINMINLGPPLVESPTMFSDFAPLDPYGQYADGFDASAYFMITDSMLEEALGDLSTIDSVDIYFQLHLSRTSLWRSGLYHGYGADELFPPYSWGGWAYGETYNAVYPIGEYPDLTRFDEATMLGSYHNPGSSGDARLVNGDKTVSIPVPQQPPARLDGYKWNDIDGNGLWEYTDSNSNGVWDLGEPGEPGLENWPIFLSGHIEGMDFALTTLTDETGYYEFPELTYGIRYITENKTRIEEAYSDIKFTWLETLPKFDIVTGPFGENPFYVYDSGSLPGGYTGNYREYLDYIEANGNLLYTSTTPDVGYRLPLGTIDLANYGYIVELSKDQYIVSDFNFGNMTAAPNVEIRKTGDELSKIGDDVVYSFEIENTGNVAIELVNIFDDQIGELVGDPDVIGTIRQVLQPGEIDTFTRQFTIPEDASNPFVNNVIANYTFGDTEVTDSDNHSTELFQPSIEISKVGDKGLAKVGDIVNYTITVTNTSSGNTPNLIGTVTDSLLGVLDNNLVLSPGAVEVYNVSRTVLETDPDSLVNTATVQVSPDGFPNEYEESASWETNLYQPSIDVTKVGDDLSKIGDDVEYTITVYNNSSSDTPEMSFNIVDTMLAINEDVVIANGDNYVITKAYTIPEGATNPYTNIVDVTTSFAQLPDTYTDSASWDIDLFEPSIEISKVGDKDLAKVGDIINYTITVTNTSSGNTPNLIGTVIDSLLGVLDNNLVLSPGAVEVYNVSRTVLETDPDPLVNTATVQVSPDGFPNEYEESASWETNLYQPSIDVTKVGDDLSKIGDDVEYTITVYNNSTAGTPEMSFNIVDTMLGIDEDVVIANGDNYVITKTHTIPDGASDPYVNTVEVTATFAELPDIYTDTASWETALFEPSIEISKVGDKEIAEVGDIINYVVTVTNTSSGNTPNLIGTVTDSLLGVLDNNLVLSPGAVEVYNVSRTVLETDPDPLVNTATVQVSPDGFPNEYEESASWEVSLFKPSIDVTKVGDDLSKIGDDVEYTITVYNNSTAGTPEMSFNIVDTMLGIDEDVVIANGDNYVITKTHTIPDGASDPYVNTVEVTATFAELPDIYTDTASWETALFEPSIEISKVGDKEIAEVGDIINYVVTVTNTSSADTPNLIGTVTDSLLGVLDNNLVLSPGAEEVYNVSYTVLETDPDPLVNTATVQVSPDGFPNEYEESASWEVSLFKPSIDVTKVGDDLSKIGDYVEYTITVYNNSSQGTSEMSFNIVDTMLGIDEDVVIANGDNYVITKTHTIPDGASDPYVNTVEVTATFAELPDIYTDTASWETALFEPSIEISKVGDKEIAEVGDIINYVVTVTNTSSADTPNLIGTVTDSLLGVLDNNLVLSPGAEEVYNVSYTVLETDPDPLVNTATVQVSPDGFPNEYEESASWEVTLNTIIYEEQTAWGYLDGLANPFSDVDSRLGNWGWTNGPLTMGESYVLDLYAGAGGNDLEKGLLVGEVTVEYSIDGTVTVIYKTDAITNPEGETFEIIDAHLWVGNEMLPLIRDKYTNAPGRLTDSNWYVDNDEFYYEFQIEGLSGEIYVAVHAVVNIPID